MQFASGIAEYAFTCPLYYARSVRNAQQDFMFPNLITEIKLPSLAPESLIRQNGAKLIILAE